MLYPSGDSMFVGCLVWVPLEDGDNGDRTGGIVQVGESERQTLG